MAIRAKPVFDLVTRLPNPEGRQGKLRLDKNEHTRGLPSELVLKGIAGITPEMLATYPEVRPLYSKLATSLGISESNLMLTSGSDPAIKSLFEVFVSEADRVILLDPTYAMFHVYAKMFGARVVNVAYGPDLLLDTDALLDAITNEVRLLAIPNPNSPTGTVIKQDVLLNVIDKAREFDVVVAIDEAYYPFCSQSMIEYINQYDNLVVTRTFSKAFGLAGLRLGYIAGGKMIVDMLMKTRPMYEINGVASYLGCFMLDHMHVVDEYVQQVNEGKRFLESELIALGFRPYPTHANFMLVPIERDSERNAIRQSAAERGILIGGTLPSPLEDCIRITLGPLEDMRPVVDAVKNAVVVSV